MTIHDLFYCLPATEVCVPFLNIEPVCDLLTCLDSRASFNCEAVCKVHGLTVLLQVGTLWRCSDCLFFEVPPLSNDALLTTLHSLLINVLQTIDHFKICLGAPLLWLEKPRNHMGQDVN